MIPDSFYYEARHRQLEYSKHPPGELYPELWLSTGKPFKFERRTVARAPKTIILNNWLLSVWDQTQKLNYQAKLQELLTTSPGFNLYLPRDGKLIKLTLENLASELAHTEDLIIHRNIELAHQSSRELGLPLEQLYILDEYQPDFSPPERFRDDSEGRIWRLSHLLRLSSVQQSQLLSNLSSLSPPLHTIWVDCYSEKAKQMLENLQSCDEGGLHYDVGIADVDIMNKDLASDFFEKAIPLVGNEGKKYIGELQNLQVFHLRDAHFPDQYARSQSFGSLTDLSLIKHISHCVPHIIK